MEISHCSIFDEMKIQFKWGIIIIISNDDNKLNDEMIFRYENNS